MPQNQPSIEKLKLQIFKLEKNIKEVEATNKKLQERILYESSLFHKAQNHEGIKRIHAPSVPNLHGLLFHCYHYCKNPDPQKQYRINEPISQIIALNRDATGNTLLHLCVAKGELDGVKELLTLGADPRVQNKAGSCALDFAKMIKIQKETEPNFKHLPADEILEVIQEHLDLLETLETQHQSPKSPRKPTAATISPPRRSRRSDFI